MPDSPELWGNNGLVGDGRYRLTRRLGRGGMAEVFGAEDLRLGRTVAVKLLRSDLAEDPVSKARFTREAQSVAGLNHHAVVAVYDSGEEIIGGNVTPYIVMELVEGRTIRDLLLGSEAPPPDQALIIVSGVLEALAYSHQHGIVHRDIKPANVIITQQGAVKVMDFGIARAMHGASNTMTQTGMVMGTPQYLSPEQALGHAVDTRSDLYATGCLLYELLTARPPFTGETPLSVVYQHVQDEPVPPSEMSPSAPPELDGLVLRALAKEPDDRFQSAEEMRGLTQFGLQMLREHGGHTGGVWDTGPVHHTGATTRVMGAAGADARSHPQHGDTSQLAPPMLMGSPDRDDEGGGRRGARRGGSGKYAVLAFLAVVAVAVGLYFGLTHDSHDPGGDTGKKTTEPQDKDTHKKRTTSPDQTQQPGTGGDTGDWTPTQSPTQTSPGPTDGSTDKPTRSPSSSQSGGQNGHGGQNGGDGGDSSSPTGKPSPPGKTDGGGGDGGAGGDGGDQGGADNGGLDAGGETGG